jgi:26S proteasome regulatory subunit T3
LDVQKQEIKESIELPLSHPDLYYKLGIDPPSGKYSLIILFIVINSTLIKLTTGVLLYGPPGTGKTMMAKAVASNSNATFIRVAGSEFVQKYLGEGPRMVREVFKMARENAPSIIFIDEVDSIATKRFDAQTGADREVQRVLIELLTQVGSFYLFSIFE